MSGTRDIMTEDDGGGGSVLDPAYARGGAARPDIQDAVSPFASTRDSTTPRPRPAANEPELIAVDVDGTESALTQDENGDGTYVERQAEAERRQTARDRMNRPAAERRQSQRQARDAHERELAQIKAENAELRDIVQKGVMPRMQEFDRSRIETAVHELDRQYNAAEAEKRAANAQISEAMQLQDSAGFTAALEARDAAMLRSNDLAGKRAQARQILEQFNAQGGQDSGASRSTQDRQAPAPMPARVKAYVDQFVDAHPWFKAGDARDLDSRVVTMIDDQVKADGYNEGTQDYWDELSDRLRAAPQLAHRFRESGRDAGGQGRAVVPPQQRGPQMAPAVNRQPRAGASDNQVYLTPERKAALIQVGALAADGRTVANPAKFQRVLKSYQEFDRDQTGSRA